MTQPTGVAPGSTADYCSSTATDGHHMATNMRGGASVHVKICTLCDWIDFDDLDQQVRQAAGDPTVEHGQLYASGAVLVRKQNDRVEAVYPIAEWIEHNQRHGGIVLRRTVIVVEDWHEVAAP